MIELIAKQKKPLWLRVLIVLLVAVILIASPIRVLMQAHEIAVVDDAAAGIVALLLVAGGYTFANRDTLTECAWNLWQGMSGELKSGILSVATIWAENQGQVNIWKVSASLKDMFLDYLDLNYDPENAYISNASRLINVYYDDISRFSDDGNASKMIGRNLISPDTFYKLNDDGAVWTYAISYTDNGFRIVKNDTIDYATINYKDTGDIGTCDVLGWFFCNGYILSLFYKYQIAGQSVKYAYKSFYSLNESYMYAYNALAEQIYDFPVMALDDSKLNFKDLPDEPVLQLPATTNITNIYNTTYADVTSPSYQLDQGQIAALPVDVPTTTADAGTGEGTGEGTGAGTETGGILGTLQGLWDWLKSILQAILNGITAIPSALSGILDAILSFFDSPSNFSLNFEGFKNLILFNRFPFCIPFDLKNAISVFAANASDYKLSIDMDTAYFSVHQEIDLTPFALPIAFFRYGASVWFTIALILKTRELIKW